MLKGARNSAGSWAAAALLALSGPLFAQDGPITAIREAPARDRALLQQAEERLAAGNVAEALQILSPLAEQQGDRLTPAASAGEEFTTYIPLQEAIFRRIVLDPAASAEMRSRRGDATGGEPPRPGRLNANVFRRDTAEEWLAKADELLRLGRYGDARDYLLGISKAAAGDWASARFFLAERSERDAEILARLVLISLLEGCPREATAVRDVLAERFPEAKGVIAGREEALLPRVDRWIAELSIAVSPRTGSATHLNFSIAAEGAPLWRVDREEATATPRASRGVFPGFAAGRIFLSTGDALYALPLEERGDASRVWPAPLVRGTIKPDRGAPPLGATAELLSVSEECVFARLGEAATRKRSGLAAEELAPGVLVGVDASRGGRLLPAFPLAPGREEQFDGAVVADGDHLFATVRKRDDARTQLLVRRIDIASARVVWERVICDAESRGRGLRDEAAQSGLLLDGERLYVATHLGCVACIDAPSGAVRWLTRYRRSEFPAEEQVAALRWNRGADAMALQGDRLVVVAADSPRVFALNRFTGETLWSTRRELMNDAYCVLGATEEEVVLMGESVYWLDAANGQVKACYPERWAGAEAASLSPHAALGRGIWAGDAVWLPTRETILRLQLLSEGKVAATAPLTLPERGSLRGNLAYHDGRLYWASEGVLLCYRAAPEGRITASSSPRQKE